MSDDAAAQKARTSRQFDARAADFDPYGVFAHFGKRLVKFVGVESGQRVLDVATGRGAVLFAAAERVGPAGQTVGVDFAESMVAAANEEAERLGLGRPVRTMDAEQLDFPDAAFDRVFCGFGVMFFPHLEQALAEFRRVLEPGGRLGVSTWRATRVDDLQAVLDEMGLVGPDDQKPSGWITEPGNLKRPLERAGFRDIDVIVDSKSFHYADAEDYWQHIHGTPPGRIVDKLRADQVERVRAGLAERLQVHRQADGIHVVATALLAVANR